MCLVFSAIQPLSTDPGCREQLHMLLTSVPNQMLWELFIYMSLHACIMHAVHRTERTCNDVSRQYRGCICVQAINDTPDNVPLNTMPTGDREANIEGKTPGKICGHGEICSRSWLDLGEYDTTQSSDGKHEKAAESASCRRD